MLLQGNVGFQSVGDGAPNVFGRLSRAAALCVDEVNGRFYELASRGKIYSASNQAAAAMSALSTTATGFILNNPIGSNITVSLLDVCVALATAAAGISPIGLAGNAAMQAVIPTTLTALTVVNNQLGNAAVGVAQVWNAATLATAPTFIRMIGGGPVATGGISAPFIRDEVAGQIVLLPGTLVTVNRLTTAQSALVSMAWAEPAL